jgi:hypothetical protein
MPKKRRIYASSLNNVAKCPSFDWKESADSKYAARGTAIHEALEHMDPGNLPTEDIKTYDYGLKVKDTYLQEFVDANANCRELVEAGYKLPGIGTCKIDYLLLFMEHATVIDWKTGSTPHYAETDLQGKAYALVLFITFPKLWEARVVFADLDLERYSEHTFKRDDFQELHTDVYSAYYAAVQDSPEKKPCDICSRCEHSTSCPALSSKSSQALTHVSAPELPDLAQVQNWTPDQKGEFLDRLKQVKDFLGSVESEIRSTATAENCPTGYAMAERQGNRQIQDVRHAVDVFQEMGIPDPVITRTLKISLGEIQKAYTEKRRAEVEECLGKLPRGFIKATEQEFYETLDSRGLISRAPGITYMKKQSAKQRQLTEKEQ